MDVYHYSLIFSLPRESEEVEPFMEIAFLEVLLWFLLTRVGGETTLVNKYSGSAKTKDD